MQDLAQQANKLIGVRLSPAQLALFEKYESELLLWNERVNLTALRKPEEVRTKHFLDSLTCLLAMRDKPAGRLVDVGTGAGFPGIPLKIACPSLRLTLVESVGKKADFCRYMIAALGLEGATVLRERAENLGQMASQRESYDWAVGRAVANLPVLAEYLLPLVKVGGQALAMKGESGPVEAQAAEQSMRLLGGQLRQLIPVALPGVAEERYVVVIDKVSATPAGYPRRVGVPAKQPLK